MKTIQEMLEELSQCIVTVSGEFRIRTNWKGGKVPQPDLDVFDPNVPFCIENVGDVPVEIGLYNYNGEAVRSNCKISTDLKTWSDYNIVLTNDSTSNDSIKCLKCIHRHKLFRYIFCRRKFCRFCSLNGEYVPLLFQHYHQVHSPKSL